MRRQRVRRVRKVRSEISFLAQAHNVEYSQLHRALMRFGQEAGRQYRGVRGRAMSLDAPARAFLRELAYRLSQGKSPDQAYHLAWEKAKPLLENLPGEEEGTDLEALKREVEALRREVEALKREVSRRVRVARPA